MHRIAAVSFLNSKPLIQGLDKRSDVELLLEVPSRLIDLLQNGRADVALLPVIDYQRMPGLTLIPAGGIGSDGPTLTVRVFSRVPIAEIRILACDWHSHTSVALARIILSRRYNLRPEFIDIRNASDDPHQAQLLIGDKVILEEPKDFPHQLDLGAEWKTLTGLPFVFAAWMGREGADMRALYNILESAKRDGISRIDQIVRHYALPLGWPADLAHTYLTRNLSFDVGEREIEAIERFHQMAREEGMFKTRERGLRIWRG